ncbi:MAG: hypothetical protein JW395_0142 [Nitrospira sp.]|nr:hypothetical protein [Nitrospira sp.]
MLKRGRGSWDDPRARATRSRGLPSLDARRWDHPSHPLLSDSLLRPCLGQSASLGEEAVPADLGRVGEITARVGRVRSLDILSILRWHFLVIFGMLVGAFPIAYNDFSGTR